ncbi:MAG: FG-GAP-like repeat-containing protein [Microcoleaceae cyanobacterium]
MIYTPKTSYPNPLQPIRKNNTIIPLLSRAIIVIDARVQDFNILLKEIAIPAKIVIIEAEQDGIQVITKALSNQPGLTHLHLVCHGQPGEIQLGKTKINQGNIQQYSAQLQQWNISEILLYSCSVAAQSQPRSHTFLQQFHQLTGANIAATSQPMGCEKQGGNWQFDTCIGSIQSQMAFSSQVLSAYPHLFVIQFNDEPIQLPGVQESSVAWGDYDNDGDFDIAITGIDENGNPITQIYRNNNNNFNPLPNRLAGVALGSVAWGDYDSDGNLDLLVTGEDENETPTTLIYRNNPNGNNNNNDNNDNDRFQLIATNLVGVANGEGVWGDYDNDGDLDIFLTGETIDDLPFSEIYRNDDGNFIAIDAGLTDLSFSTGTWGDYDVDGDLDLFIAGNNRIGPVSQVYLNENGTFIDTGSAIAPVENGAGAWGDYDADGDLDLVVTGNDGNAPTANIYQNDNNTFVPLTDAAAPLAGVEQSDAVWADLDNDGDVDLALAGIDANNAPNLTIYENDNGSFADFADNAVALPDVGNNPGIAAADFDGDGDLDLAIAGFDGNNAITQIYNNTGAVVNTPPTIPDDPNSGVAGDTANLNWAPSTDLQTPIDAITYNLRVGTTPGGFDIVNPTLTTPSPGNVGSTRDWQLNDLAPGTYYWSVQGVDSAYAVSDFSVEQEFTILPPQFIQFNLGLPNLTNGSVAWGDYNSNGTLDFVITGEDANGDAFSQIYQSGGGGFGNINAGLPGVNASAVDWGDYDNDGDLDLLLTGNDPATNNDVTRIYRNDGNNSFININGGLTGVSNSAAVWGDYDNDGDLDAFIAGENDGDDVAIIYRNEGVNGFVDSNSAITGVTNAAAAWGDFDNDGDLDLAVTGNSGGNPTSTLYRNDGGIFVNQNAAFANIADGSVAWGDYDNDGDLDLLLTGLAGVTPVSQVYRNDGGSFININAALVGVQQGEGEWGDYDNDGDLDIVIIGIDQNANPISTVYVNNGLDSFTPLDFLGLENLQSSSVAGGDYNNDNTLDLILMGQDATGNPFTSIYQNTVTPDNTPPTPPTTLTAAANGSQIIFSWNGATDAETPVMGLSYNLQVGTTPGGTEIISPLSIGSGQRQVVNIGNAQSNTSWTLNNFTPGTYFWSVQAVDTSFVGSTFATGSFDVLSPTYDFSLANYTTAEGDITNSVNDLVAITRSGDTTTAEAVTVSLTGDSATANNDFTAEPIIVNFGVGETTQFVPIEILGDRMTEGDETLQLTLSNFSQIGMAGTQNTATLTIINDDTPAVTVTPPVTPTTSETGDSSNFDLVLTSQPTANVTVSLVSDDPTEGNVTPTLTFTPETWDIPQTATVTGVDDNQVDGNVAYTISSTVTSVDGFYNGIEVADVTLTNTDDDVANITVTPVNGLTTTEGGGSATFTVVLETQPNNPVAINLASDNPAEGTVSTPVLNFTAANWNTPQTVTVTGVDDDIADDNISYNIVLDAAISIDPNYNSIDPADVTVINADNESPGVTVNPTEGLTTSEAGNTASFEVFLNTQPIDTVNFGVSSNDPTEGTVSISTISFTPDNWSIPQTVTVSGVNDDFTDGDVPYTIDITPDPNTSDLNYQTIDPTDVNLVNQDNDIADILVSPATGLVTTEASGNDTFTVVLTSQPTSDVDINLESNNPAEGRVSTPTLTFNGTNWQTPQTVTVTGIDDEVADGNQQYQILTTSSSLDPSYAAIDPADVTVVNTDDDEAGVEITPTMGLITTESGTAASFDVILTAQPTGDVLLNFNSSNLQEGNVLIPAVNFTPANWNIPQQITVLGVDDIVADGNVTYSIVSAAAVSLDPNYDGFNPDDVTVVNVDNETPGITINPLNGLTTSEAGETTDSFNVILNTQPTDAVTLFFSSSDETEGTVVESVTFDRDEWDTPEIITVTGVDDIEVDGDVEYSILTGLTVSTDLNYNGIDPDNITVTNIDNDVPAVNLLVSPNIGSEAEATLVTVTANTTNPVNGNQTVNLGVSGAGITNADYTLSDTVITIPDGENTGSVTFAIQNDELIEGVEDATLTLTNPSEGIELGTITTSNVRIIDNNNPAIVEFSSANYRVDEAGNIIDIVVTVNRAGNVLGTSTVEVELTGGTATAGEDFNDVPITVDLAADEIERTIFIPILEDRLIEGEETFNIELVNPSAGTQVGPQNTATVTILDNDEAGISLTQTNLSLVESGEAETYSIFLTSPPENPVTVTFDFDPAQIEPIAPIVFDQTNWNTPQDVQVSAIGEDGLEGIQLTSIAHQVTSEDPNYNGFQLDNIAVEIVELQSPGLLVEPVNLEVIEGESSDSYSISLTTVPDDIVTVQFNTGSQINPLDDITFDSTNWNLPQTIVVSALDDILIEDIHQGAITHQLISNDEDYNLLGIAAVVVEITDNDVEDPIDQPVGVQINQGNLTVSESGTEGDYNFVLTAEPTSSVTINIATEDQLNPITPITFTPSNWNIPQTVTFTAVDNAVVEGDRTATIRHSIDSEDSRYEQLIIADVEVNIIDDDTNSQNPNPNQPIPTVEILQTGNLTNVSETGTVDIYSVVLTTPPTSDVIVTLNPDSQVDVGNGTENSLELIFTPDNWDLPQFVTVAADDDSIVEAAVHTSTINHVVSSDDPDYGVNPLITIDGVANNNLTVNIEDNDEPLPPGTAGVKVIQLVRSTNVLEGFGEDSYLLELESEPTAEVIVTISQPDFQLEVDRPTLSFTPSDWDQPKLITVTAIDDIANEGDHVANLFHTATSLDPRYNNISIDSLSVDIADNDNLGDQLNLNNRSVLAFTERDDLIMGSGDNDVLYGLEGNDRLMGMASRDYLSGQEGSDGIAGDAGDDIILGGAGHDHLYGNQDNDQIFGDAGSDRLFGGSGDDRLSGGLNNDRLSPDQGTDTLTGGLGQDVFVLGMGSGGENPSDANLITDYNNTEDTIELVGSLTFNQLNFISTGGGTLLQIRSTGEYLALLSGVSLNLSTDASFFTN